MANKRIAILGGGLSGLTAAYELEAQRKAGQPLDWHLYEASEQFGGTVRTTRHRTAQGEFICEDGPDSWVTEKPWARELAEELGLGDQIIASKDETKKTYIWIDGQLVAMPDRMRLMVPEDLATLDASPLFSAAAKGAYALELQRAAELKATAPQQDESVASFVLRHFGAEVLDKIGAPLLSGVFGGDVTKLSVRAVMPAFTSMEASFGSLVLALQQQRVQRGDRTPQPTFSTLRRGMGSLVETLIEALPAERLHLRTAVRVVTRSPRGGWLLGFEAADYHACALGMVPFDHLVFAVPADATRRLLGSVDAMAAALVPTTASSAVLTTFCWQAAAAATFTLPPGFGFLVPQRSGKEVCPKLLAATFTVQKFPNRAPPGARIVRAFFGGHRAEGLQSQTDRFIAAEAWRELGTVFPGLPQPEHAMTTIVRWPRSLPQYEVGHLGRIAELTERVQQLGQLYLLGNGYRGVGVPDLIRDARAAAREVAENSR